MTLKDLSTAVHNKKYAGSNVPEHARPKKVFNDKSANELTQAIIAYFELIGWMAHRQISEGRYIPGKEYTNVMNQRKQMKGTWIPRSKAAKGCGDIRCLTNKGVTIEIEVKSGKDRQSPDQKEYQKKLEAMGGIYLIAKTWDGFFFEISKYTAGPRAERTDG